MEGDVTGPDSAPPEGDVVLREVMEQDLPHFYEQQLNPEANYMAAFTVKNPADRDAFQAHWARILGDASTENRTILYDGQVAGHVASYSESGQREVTYWLGKEYWGKGIATRALDAFLKQLDERPLAARVAKDNIASLRVLQKCGFKIVGADKGFSEARGAEVEEFILELQSSR